MRHGCRDVSGHYTALREGSLSRRRRLQVRLHLLICRHCRAFYAQMDALVALLRASAEATEPPAGDGLLAFFRSGDWR